MTVNREGEQLSTFSGRLRAERERLGMSQSVFGEACGVGKASQINYETEKRSPDSTYLMAAAGLGVDVQYLLTAQRSSDSLPSLMLHSMQQTLAEPEEFAPIPVYAAELAAGGGAENAVEEIIDHMAFRRDWLRKMGVSPAAAIIARAHGESMAPTLNNGDVVLIDRAKAEPPSKPRAVGDTRPAKIYALLDDGGARIKRVELAAPGMLAILSDNPASAPEFRPVSDVTIIGRVVWWGHTNRD